jgi:glutathione synthase/RimK-type ligase-like ATP-grasp enzyme
MIILLTKKNNNRVTRRELKKRSRYKDEIYIFKYWKETLKFVPEIVFRIGCTANVPKNKNTIIINPATGIHRVSAKYVFRKICREEGLKIPETNLCTKEHSKFPAVVRPFSHHQGRHFFFYHTEKDYISSPHFNKSGYYISEYIKKDLETRVYIFNLKVFNFGVKKGEPNLPNWNSHATNLQYTDTEPSQRWIEHLKVAVKASHIAHLEFCAVDLMEKNGQVYLIEVNSSPSLLNDLRQERATACLDYTIYFYKYQNKKLIFKLPDSSNYKDYLHPAVW